MAAKVGPSDGFVRDRESGWFKGVSRKMCDLAHIKAREKEWAKGLGLNIGTFLKIGRQEEIGRRSLHKTINSKGKPERFRE
eukprot:8684437-Heterocapsa_arctica.AAC.1